MGINKITLPVAYMIETLRSNGISDQELLTQVENQDVSPWKELNTHFDFNELVKLAAQDQNAFDSIILDGYEVKFVTIKGVQTLLNLKFEKIQERDYLLTDKGITGLHIEDQQLSTLRQMLSTNWVIDETSPKKSSHISKVIKIELA